MINKEELIEKAFAARMASYSPYSKFKVGAAILLKNGKYSLGANIENSSYGLTVCAERNAVFKAITDGYSKNDFVAMAVIADTDGPVIPCGACLQVLSELFPSDAPIYLTNLKKETRETTLSELFPVQFKL